MPLDRTRERIPNQLLHRIPRQGLRYQSLLLQPLRTIGIILILQIDLIVQERHDETRRRASSLTLLPLIAADRIIRVQRALALFIHPAQNRSHVVGKEPLVVEDVAQALRARVHADVFAVLIFVQFDNGVEALFEGAAVGGEAHDRQHDARARVRGPFAPDFEEFGRVARVDVVAACAAGVACEDREGRACDAEGGAAVVRVAGG